MKKSITFFLISILSVSLFSQGNNNSYFDDSIILSDSTESADFTGSVQLALSNTDYMVTAGDVYSLTYSANGIPVSYTIPVDPTYKIRVANLAVLDAYNKSYINLKKQVEEIVLKNYPLCGVQFVLLNPASFKVLVKGEVKAATEKNAWALTRLSSIISGTTTPLSSIRDITITSKNGKKSVYDLFLARRFGDYSQNPYVRPGDIITVNKIKRVVNINGTVERPGRYELMKGENLKQLIEFYGNGLSEYADTNRIILERDLNNSTKGSAKIYLTQKDIDSDYELFNGDSITIKNITELTSSIIVEGILNVSFNTNEIETEKYKDPLLIDSQNEKQTAKDSNLKKETAANPVQNNNLTQQEINKQKQSSSNETISRTFVKFKSGENYASLIRRIQSMFNSNSDLQSSYIERDGKKIPLNLELSLYNAEYLSPYSPQADDKLVIPFKQHMYKVLLTGEVKATVEQDVWPQKRLSEFLEDNLTDYSSKRNVQVISVDGTVKECDLFLAERFGKEDQNPYIKAGERINVQRMERKVYIYGSVERPGTYQLLPGENLKELVEYYGGGLTSLANTNKIKVTRISDDENKTGFVLYLNEENLKNNFELSCYDVVQIDNYRNLRSVIFVEGAVNASEGVELTSSDRFSVQFENGTTYDEFIRTKANWFKSNSSDIENSYIQRGEEVIKIDIKRVLYDVNYKFDEKLCDNDILRIPFKQLFVTVAGAVHNPGRYPYVIDRTYEYYIGLAGGFISEKNSLDAVKIIDINGKKLGKKTFITPEATITAESNSFLYKFNQYSGVVTTILSIITTSLTAIALINK